MTSQDSSLDHYEDQLRAELSRKLTLLVSVAKTDTGEPLTFKAISAALAERGVVLSRARWSYMLHGNGPLVTNPRLLRALADVLGVDVSYLTPGANGPLPERIEAQLNVLRAIRYSKFKVVAARELGEVAPRTLDAITEILNQHLDDNTEGPAGTDSR
jgi:hypothetical protein